MSDTDPRDDSDAQPEHDPFEGLAADDLDLEIDLPDLNDAGSAPPESPAQFPNPVGESTATTDSTDREISAPATTTPVRDEPPRDGPSTGGKRKLLLAGVGALLVVVLPLGWLGWSFMQDRTELDEIDSGLRSARDAAEKTTEAAEDGPERQQAEALAARIGAINSAAWWDRVVVRIIAADEISRLKSEAGELTGELTRRSANRAWWRERMSALDEQLAAAGRTIQQVEVIKEELATPALPHSNDGGVGQDAIAATQSKIDAALAELVQMQAQAITTFAAASQSAKTADSVERLASIEAEIDAAKPVDRRPPEMAQVKQAATRAVAAAREVLQRRDAILNDLTAVQESATALDRETADSATAQALSDRIASITFDQSDSRFKGCIELKAAAQAAVDQALADLASRDAALAWVQDWMQRINETTDLEGLLVALQPLANEAPPSSELETVRSALMDLEARVKSRTAELIAAKAEQEASMARAAACAARLDAFATALEKGDFSTAASELDLAIPETEEQTAEVDVLKAAFASLLEEWLSKLPAEADEARTAADQLRACLANDAVARVAPGFAERAAEAWPRVIAAENKSLYQEVRSLSSAPAGSFEPIAAWYLDATRTRSETLPMRAAVEAALEALKQPAVTLQVEGIEWSSIPCTWSRPQTDVTVAIGDEVQSFRLGPVVPQSTSLLTTAVPFERRFTLPRDTTIMLSVRGNFGCDDAASRFRGSGDLTIDDLRAGGRFALPFSNGGPKGGSDDAASPHKLIFVAFPDESVRKALQLPEWTSDGSAAEEPVPADPTGGA